MITREQVRDVVQQWEMAGLKPPTDGVFKAARMVEDFMARFYMLDEPTLAYVAKKLALGHTWPTFGLIEQVAKEYRELHSQYVYIDYLKELRKKAYGEQESFENFVQRIGEQYFPGQGKEWCMKHAFILNFYGIRIAACKECDGNCPQQGHRYLIRLKKGSDVPVPYLSMEICPSFKQAVDRQGRKLVPVVDELPPPPEEVIGADAKIIKADPEQLSMF